VIEGNTCVCIKLSSILHVVYMDILIIHGKCKLRQPWAGRGMGVSIRRLGTPITGHIRAASCSLDIKTHFKLCMSFHFGINDYFRRSHISFLQRSAHRLLILIRSTISRIEAAMSLQHFLISMGSSQGSVDHMERSHFGELHKSYAINSLYTSPDVSFKPPRLWHYLN
jgi:hypothetical protein